MFLLAFAPEQWLYVRLFRQFIGPPFPDRPELRKGTASVENHLSKYEHIARLTVQLRPTLSEDESQLRESGYTPALRSQEYAALIETLFCELYASLDGVRRAVYGANQGVQGVQNKSTKKLFENAFEKKYGSGLPEEIRQGRSSMRAL